MKILYLITKAAGGGAQQYVYDLAVATKAKGDEVVVAYGTPGPLLERLTAAGLPTIRIGGLTRNVGILSELVVAWNLYTTLKSERPHVIHLNSSKAGGLGAFAARLAGVPRIVFTAHGWPHKEPRSAPARIIIWLASWLTVLLCDQIIVVSNDDLKRAPIFFSKQKITLIRNGVEESELKSREEARAALMKLTGRSLPARCILTLAELHRNKGIDLLVRAFKEISDRKSDIGLIVLGEGEERDHLEKLIADLALSKSVVLAGFVPNGHLYLRAGDIFVLASRKEGLPFALLEAGRSGIPTIVSSAGGMREVVEDGVSGRVVRTGDVNELTQVLTSLLEHPEESTRLGTALRARVEKEFSKERMVQETFAVYRPT